MPLLEADGKKFNIEAVLFDKDGTLLDFKVMWLEWSKYVIDEIRLAVGDIIPREILEQAMGINLAEWYVDPEGPLAGGTMSGLRAALVKAMQEAGIREKSAQDLVTDVSRRSEITMDWKMLTKPVSGLHQKLQYLRNKNFKIAVVTADITERSKISLESLNLISYFDAVIGADLVERSKPAPDMALLACRLLGVEPGNAVVVGDTPRDIHMAKSAGAGSIGVLSGVCNQKQLAIADAVISSVADLK